ncbi:ABC-ATPase domain-containing protein [uncultured Kocuria sp.]|uniref:ABC-ATPase domain-containing protein n=1 Tax=uncultured Kocuria sp. TaxID=259305 RepID=UPI002592046E|nr:ABC-ATPase domain-containing protein [uncultured Kocuria sp.]MCT1367807.1 ABC-ATPase domain-containing protein [Rothia sp. p3-SID1597]
MNHTLQGLRSTLHQLDGNGYGAYKRLKGSYDYGEFDLVIDHVQSDPYAPPSSIRVIFSLADTSIPHPMCEGHDRRVATADFIARDLTKLLCGCSYRGLSMSKPGQEILERTNVVVSDDTVEVRLSVSLPAGGRRIKGRAAAHVLTNDLPDLIERSALLSGMDQEALSRQVDLYLDQRNLQHQLADRGLVSFVGDGSVLPRSSGDSDLPLRSGVAFRSPQTFREEFTLPSGRTVTGMGVPRGITVIVGGGYHGKSTLLRAMERGVYPHVGGDGREWVLTAPDAVSIRAEDGRAVTGVDISPFIANLPSGTRTESFTTTNASGSTSQAANLAEALELGTSLLLIDEDTSATNFMIRDPAMRELIPAGSEPITPFVDRVRPLLEERNTSTVLVAGGTGAFFGVADHVIAMDEYIPSDVTARAHEIAARDSTATGNDDAAEPIFARRPRRVPQADALSPSDRRKPARGRGLDSIQVGREDIDVAYLAQLVDSSQTNAIALCLEAVTRELDGSTDLVASVHHVMAKLERDGLDALVRRGGPRGDLAWPRAQELHGAISRYRKLKLRS